MGSMQAIITDPDFNKLSVEDQRAAISHFDPDFSRLSPQEQEVAHNSLVQHYQHPLIEKSSDWMGRAFKSALQTFGVPTSREEMEATQKREEALPTWQRVLPHAPGSSPSAAHSIATAIGGPGGDILFNAPHAIGAEVKKAGGEFVEASKAAMRGEPGTAAGHAAGAAGHTGAALLAPIFGESLSRAGEQIGSGQVAEGLGTTGAILAPFVAGEIASSTPASLPLKAATKADHIEALTGFLKTTKTDPYTTATTALPEARAMAAKMNVDPATFQGRAGGEAVLGENGIFDKAIQAHRAEYAAMRKPFLTEQMDTTPIAQSYLDRITNEMRLNDKPAVNRLEAQAKKFAYIRNGRITAPRVQSLEDLDNFRVRLNNELDAYEQKPLDAQLRSDLEVKADKAAVNEARNLVYKTIARKSGVPEQSIRDLQSRQGALIEARRDLSKAFNDASGAQGEAVSKTLREKATSTYPSPRGVQHTAIREIIGPKPLSVFNNRLQQMFSGLDRTNIRPLPSLPVSLGTAAATVGQVKPPYTTDESHEMTPQQRATAWILAAKKGSVPQEEADRHIQKLVGSGGRKMKSIGE